MQIQPKSVSTALSSPPRGNEQADDLRASTATVKPNAASADVIADKSSGRKLYGCKYCDKSFTKPSALRSHEYTHTGEKPFACHIIGCNRRFAVVSNLRRHFKVHAPKPSVGSTRMSYLERLQCLQRLEASLSPRTLSPVSVQSPSSIGREEEDFATTMRSVRNQLPTPPVPTVEDVESFNNHNGATRNPTATYYHHQQSPASALVVNNNPAIASSCCGYPTSYTLPTYITSQFAPINTQLSLQSTYLYHPCPAENDMFDMLCPTAAGARSTAALAYDASCIIPPVTTPFATAFSTHHQQFPPTPYNVSDHPMTSYFCMRRS